MLRGLVLTKMGRYGDKDTVAEARKRFDDHVSGTKLLPADLRGPVSVSIIIIIILIIIIIKSLPLYGSEM